MLKGETLMDATSLQTYHTSLQAYKPTSLQLTSLHAYMAYMVYMAYMASWLHAYLTTPSASYQKRTQHIIRP